MKLVLVTIFVAVSWSAANAKGWRGIVPLHSNRADVERLLGPSSHECKCIYNSNGDFVRVEYATAPCKGDPLGWNVSADIVLSIRVRPAAPQKFSEPQFNKSEFQKAVSDTGTT